MEPSKPKKLKLSNGEDAFARNTDPVTSKDAAVRVRGERTKKLEDLVVEILLEHQHLFIPIGMTMFEVAAIVEASGRATVRSITPRFAPLVRQGRIIVVGKKWVPETKKWNQVYVAIPPAGWALRARGIIS